MSAQVPKLICDMCDIVCFTLYKGVKCVCYLSLISDSNFEYVYRQAAKMLRKTKHLTNRQVSRVLSG